MWDINSYVDAQRAFPYAASLLKNEYEGLDMKKFH